VPSVYVASPLGFAEATISFMNDKFIPAIKAAGVTPINPWDLEAEPQTEIDAIKAIDSLKRRREAWAKIVLKLGKSNADKIAGADGVVAVLDGVDIDSGTAAEIGYAAALGKWIIGYRGDFRSTGDDASAVVNLQVEYFILKNQGCIVRTLAELTDVLTRKRS
jgi:nucleoside 2-deoxyribosyltransferase